MCVSVTLVEKRADWGGGVAGVEAGVRGRQRARIIMYTYALLWNCSGYGA